MRARCGDGPRPSAQERRSGDVFLIVEQIQLEQNLDEVWLFQATMTVRADDSGAVFVDRSRAAATLQPAFADSSHML
jgi:hypothetical protein